MASSVKGAKCGTCGQTGNPLDMVVVKDKTYHKSCFKCFSHEDCTEISPSNCVLIDGTLYCNRHYSSDINRHLFGGIEGQCFICQQPVYLPEKVIVKGLNYHRKCFKCCHGCPISESNHAMYFGALYCDEHKEEHEQLDGDSSRIYDLPELLKKGIYKLEPPRRRRGPSSSGAPEA